MLKNTYRPVPTTDLLELETNKNRQKHNCTRKKTRQAPLHTQPSTHSASWIWTLQAWCPRAAPRTRDAHLTRTIVSSARVGGGERPCCVAQRTCCVESWRPTAAGWMRPGAAQTCDGGAGRGHSITVHGAEVRHGDLGATCCRDELQVVCVRVRTNIITGQRHD